MLLCTAGEEYVLLGISVLFGGSFLSFLLFLLIYGFGEVVLNTGDTLYYVRNLCKNVGTEGDSQKNVVSDEIPEL